MEEVLKIILATIGAYLALFYYMDMNLKDIRISKELIQLEASILNDSNYNAISLLRIVIILH